MHTAIKLSKCGSSLNSLEIELVLLLICDDVTAILLLSTLPSPSLHIATNIHLSWYASSVGCNRFDKT